MNNPFKTPLIRSITPYFLLAVLVLAAYMVMTEMHAFLAFLGSIMSIITPFFYGFILAYILNIPCSGIQSLLGKSHLRFIRKRQKGISILLVYVLFVMVMYLLLNLVIPYIYISVSQFITHFVDNAYIYYSGIQTFIDRINHMGIFDIEITMDVIIASINENLDVMNNFSGWFNAIFAGGFNILAGLSGALFRAFLTLVSSIYILFEKDKFKAFLARLLRIFTSPEVSGAVTKYSRSLNNYFRKYIHTQTIDGFILGTLVTVALYLLDSPYFLTLGIMLGVFNYVPYFGSIIGTAIAVLVVGLTQGLTAGLLTAAVLIPIQQLDGNVIQPKLLGESFKFSPLLVIISVTVGGAFAGVLGMIAAVPIVAALKDMLEDFLNYYERKKSLT